MLPLVPEVVNGRTHKATVVDLSPWVEYEFRVVASNSVGIGEPSRPSALLKTKAAGKSLVSVSFFPTDTLPPPECENFTAAEPLTPAGLLTYLPGILVCGCYGFMTAELHYRCKGCLDMIEVPHALLSGLEITWASNKGWSWPTLPPFDTSQNISNPHA